MVLMNIYAGNTLRTWLIALGATLATLGMLMLVRRFLLGRLVRLAGGTRTQLDDLAVDVLGGTHFLSITAVSLYAGAQFLSLAPRIQGFTRTVLFLTLLLQMTLWANRAIGFVLQRMIRPKTEGDAGSATAATAMGFAARTVLWVICLLLALDNLGVNITGLVTGLGIGGIAVALALQNILGDLFASLSIVLDKPFVIGDFLIVGEFLGSVEHVGLKTTRMRSLSGEQIIFPNGELLKSKIRNYKRMTERRVAFTLGVIYQTPRSKLEAIAPMLRRIIEAQPGVRFERAHFKTFGDSALVFEVVYFVLDPDYTRYMDLQQTINLMIFDQFETEGIAFAYPTQTLFLSRDAALSTQ